MPSTRRCLSPGPNASLAKPQCGVMPIARSDAATGTVLFPAPEDVWHQPQQFTSQVMYKRSNNVPQPLIGTALDTRVAGKTAVLGGSFDPPHWGTAWCVRRLFAAGARDVWLMPVAQHAEKRGQTAFSTRMHMTFAMADHLCATGEIPVERLTVTNVEAFVPSRGESLEVLCSMRRLFSPREFVFAVGADIGERMHLWPTAQRLQQQFTVVVLERPGGYVGAQLLAEKEAAVDISSTRIRAACARGDSIAAYTAPPVARLIQEQGLYAAQDPAFASWRHFTAALFAAVALLSLISLSGPTYRR